MTLNLSSISHCLKGMLLWLHMAPSCPASAGVSRTYCSVTTAEPMIVHPKSALPNGAWNDTGPPRAAAGCAATASAAAAPAISCLVRECAAWCAAAAGLPQTPPARRQLSHRPFEPCLPITSNPTRPTSSRPPAIAALANVSRPPPLLRRRGGVGFSFGAQTNNEPISDHGSACWPGGPHHGSAACVHPVPAFVCLCPGVHPPAYRPAPLPDSV